MRAHLDSEDDWATPSHLSQMYVYVSLPACMYVCIHVCLYVLYVLYVLPVCMYVCMCVCKYVCMDVCIDPSHFDLIKRYCFSAAVAALRSVRGHAAFAALPKRAVPSIYVFAIREPERRKCAARGMPTDIEVADTAQGKWSESAMQDGEQDDVLGRLCGG